MAVQISSDFDHMIFRGPKHRRATPVVVYAAIAVFAIFLIPARAQQGATNINALLQQAARALKAHDLPVAERAAQQVLKVRPRDARALNVIGVVRAEQEKQDEAEKLFKAAINADPKFASPYSNLGVLYVKLGRPEMAREQFEQAVQLAPQDGESRYNLALLLADSKDFTSAITQMLAIPPAGRPGDYWARLASFYLSSNRLPDAEDCLRRQLEKQPDSIAVLRQLSGVALKRGNTHAAWEYMFKARQLAPNSPELLFEYAQISRTDKQPLEAIIALRKALQLEPDRPEYLFMLGGVLLSGGGIEAHGALAYLDRYVQLKPNDADGHLLLSSAYFEERDFDRARQEIEEVRRIDPSRAEIDLQLGEIAYEAGDSAQAIERLSRFLQSNPDHAPALLTLGLAQMRNGQLEKARASLEASVRLDPAEPRTHYQLSQLLTRLGDPAAAQRERELYQKTIEIRRQRSAPIPPPAGAAKKPQ